MNIPIAIFVNKMEMLRKGLQPAVSYYSRQFNLE